MMRYERLVGLSLSILFALTTAVEAQTRAAGLPQINGCGSCNVQTDKRKSVEKCGKALTAALPEPVNVVTAGHHLTPVFVPARKVNPVPRRLADTTRARQELGFVAEVPLEEGLRRLAQWWGEQRVRKEVA